MGQNIRDTVAYKVDLIEKVVAQIKKDIEEKEDVTPIEEMLTHLSVDQLEAFLPDKKHIYPVYIMRFVRQNLGLDDEEDTSRDDEIDKMSPDEVLERVCNWEGLIDYEGTIKRWVQDIYHVKLDKEG